MNSEQSKDFESVIHIRTDKDMQLLRNIYAYGWSEMSHAQQIMLPKLIDPSTYDDVSFQYPSGMGKSGVYLLTLLYNISYNSPTICGLIVLPTRELANQVFHDSAMLARNMHINICKCIGKELVSEINPEWPTIIIGTCGKIIDIMCKKSCKQFHQKAVLEYMVIDEADNFINNGHAKNLYDLETIIKTLCTNDTHLLAISATFSNNVRDFIRSKMMRKNGRNIEEYLDDSDITLNGITQYYIDLTSSNTKRNIFTMKVETLIDIIPIIGLSRGIIFVNSAFHAQQTFTALTNENYTCDVIYGKMNQEERNAIMTKFTRSSMNFLIATDLIARGIDFKDISYVIQLELPTNMEDYIHRIGRSGRYGKIGTAVTIICGEDEERDLNTIVKKYDIDMKMFEFS